MKLQGLTAAVTGGSRGIGRGIVEAFLAEGATVVFNGRDPQKGARAIQELDAGERAHFIAGDVRDSAAAKQLVEEALRRGGRLDVMVNNAGGITDPAPVAGLSDDAWENDLRWNLSSAFYGTRHALAHMLPQSRGCIINISSVEGKLGVAGMAGYAAAKHGLHGLTKSVAAEVGRSGITVNAICPGLILTDAVREGGPSTAEAMGISYEEMIEKVFKAKTLTGALNSVAQVAAVAVLLASEAGRGITGALLSVDGGQAPY